MEWKRRSKVKRKWMRHKRRLYKIRWLFVYECMFPNVEIAWHMKNGGGERMERRFSLKSWKLDGVRQVLYKNCYT